MARDAAAAAAKLELCCSPLLCLLSHLHLPVSWGSQSAFVPNPSLLPSTLNYGTTIAAFKPVLDGFERVEHLDVMSRWSSLSFLSHLKKRGELLVFLC